MAWGSRRWLAILALATVCGFGFAFISGFSIGRYVALLPLLLTAFAVTYDRPRRLQLGGYIAAIAIYVVLSWLLSERIRYWGIQIELTLCLIAYLIAALSLRSTGHQG